MTLVTMPPLSLVIELSHPIAPHGTLKFAARTYTTRMMPDFKGHQFVEHFHAKMSRPWLNHYGQYGLKAALRADGSIYFNSQRTGLFLRP